MKLTPSMLSDITDAARRELRDSMKHKEETHEEYVAKCWVVAFHSILFKNKIVLDIELPKYNNEPYEPLD